MKTNQEIYCIIAGLGTEVDSEASAKITLKMHEEFVTVFTGIGCFEGMFSLQIKDDAKPYQMPLRYIAYAFHEPFFLKLDYKNNKTGTTGCGWNSWVVQQPCHSTPT